MPNFVVCSKNDVQKTIEEFSVTHVLSILDPNDDLFLTKRIDPQNHLKVWFLDEEDPDLSGSPTMEHAKTILKWGSNLPQNSKVIVHCLAGISRSPAVAIALWLQKNGLNKLQEAKEWIKQIRPFACPNLLLAKHFDQLFNLNGSLVELCSIIGNEMIIKKNSLNEF